MEYVLSGDRAAFADCHRHPLLPAALLRRIEINDPLLLNVAVEGSHWSTNESAYIGPRNISGLAKALSLNTCITSLNLAGNRLRSAGVRTLMAAVTGLTGLTSLNLGRNELSVDDGARVCGAAAAAGLTLLAGLELEGNGFTASSVVGCEGWREAGLSSLWDCIFFPSSFSVLMEYVFSSDRAAVAASETGLSVVFISGASGPFMFGINGPYVCTSVGCITPAFYSKLGDNSMCIEHLQVKWQIKHVAKKGQNTSAAECVCASELLEHCIGLSWKVYEHGFGHVVQRDVKMLTGSDARREASSRFMRTA
jgi:hypothetical protein